MTVAQLKQEYKTFLEFCLNTTCAHGDIVRRKTNTIAADKTAVRTMLSFNEYEKVFKFYIQLQE